MYTISTNKLKTNINYLNDDVYKYKIPNKKGFKINNIDIKDITIYNKKMARPFILKIVNHKFDKLILKLTEDMSSDSDDDDVYKKVLEEIEIFRLLIKEKYRPFLRKGELEKMAKKLKFLKTEAMRRLLNLHDVNVVSKNVGRGAR
ncbi:MAG: hypothetical protein IJL76_01500 [Bacilli bacterium]|nr:hypothetical protein [Bacilli bacterium]